MEAFVLNKLLLSEVLPEAAAVVVHGLQRSRVGNMRRHMRSIFVPMDTEFMIQTWFGKGSAIVNGFWVRQCLLKKGFKECGNVFSYMVGT